MSYGGYNLRKKAGPYRRGITQPLTYPGPYGESVDDYEEVEEEGHGGYYEDRNMVLIRASADGAPPRTVRMNESSQRKKQRRHSKVWCSCLDCCPCLTDIFGGIALYAFYLTHIALLIYTAQQYALGRGGGPLGILVHLFLLDKFGRAVHTGHPPLFWTQLFNLVVLAGRMAIVLLSPQ